MWWSLTRNQRFRSHERKIPTTVQTMEWFSCSGAMASHLLLAMSGTSPSWASQFGSPNCCIEARKRLPAARSCTPITSSTRGPHVQTCGINYTGSRFRRILEVVLDDYGTKYRKRELQASRSMRPDDVNGEDAWSSGHIEKEKCGAGGETTCECLYLKRTICDGEIVEHSGSIIVRHCMWLPLILSLLFVHCPSQSRLQTRSNSSSLLAEKITDEKLKKLLLPFYFNVGRGEANLFRYSSELLCTQPLIFEP